MTSDTVVTRSLLQQRLNRCAKVLEDHRDACVLTYEMAWLKFRDESLWQSVEVCHALLGSVNRLRSFPDNLEGVDLKSLSDSTAQLEHVVLSTVHDIRDHYGKMQDRIIKEGGTMAMTTEEEEKDET